MEEGGAGEVAPDEPSPVGADQTEEMIQESSTEATQVTTEETTTSESQQIETSLETSVPLEVEDLSSAPGEQEEPQQTQQAEPLEEPMNQSAEIPQQNIKNQLNEIIQDLENQEPQEPVEYDNSVKESDWHTWRPRGKYNIPKVEIKFDELKSEAIPDIGVKDIPKPPPAPAPVQKPQEKAEPVEMIDQYAPQPSHLMNGDLNSPSLDIPMGIPLLARVLPKEEGDGPRESIPLERLFTPATDSGEITPKKKKAFSSSAFYAPNHPTIEDQVSLAQRISTSLIDENNQMSRGQSMYIKRKKRSVKWIHQAPGEEDDHMQPQIIQPRKERAGLNVQTSMRAEHSEMQHHLQQVTVAGQSINSPDVNFKRGDLQSPTGKGAELFAKRKKRMDQFIVDETTVQKSSSYSQQQSSVMSSSFSESSSSSSMASSTQMSQQSSSKSSSGASYLRSTCTAVQPTIDDTVHGQGEGQTDGPDNLPDLTKILTKPCEPSRPVPKSNSHLQRKMGPDKSVSPSIRSQSADSRIGKNNFGQNQVGAKQFNGKLKSQGSKFSQVPQIAKGSVSPAQNVFSLSSNQNCSIPENAPVFHAKISDTFNSTSQSKELQTSSLTQSVLVNQNNHVVINDLPANVKALKSEFSVHEEINNLLQINNVNQNQSLLESANNQNIQSQIHHNSLAIEDQLDKLQVNSDNFEDNANSHILQTPDQKQNYLISSQIQNVSSDKHTINSVLSYDPQNLDIIQKAEYDLPNDRTINHDIHYNPTPHLKPGSPPIFLYTDGSEVQGTDIHQENREVSVVSEGLSSNHETGVVDSSSMSESKTNIEHPSKSLCSVLSSDLSLSACQDNETTSNKKDQPQDVLSETVRSTPSPRPVRPNSLAVIPLSSLVDSIKPFPNNTNSSSSQPVVCLPILTQPFVDIKTSFSLAPASKRRLKAVFDNVSPTEETSNSSAAIINMNANGSWYENNQIKDFINPQLEPSCDNPIVEQINLSLIDKSFYPSSIIHQQCKDDNDSNCVLEEVVETVEQKQKMPLCGDNDETVMKLFKVDPEKTCSLVPSVHVEENTTSKDNSVINESTKLQSIEDVLTNLENQIIIDELPSNTLENANKVTEEINKHSITKLNEEVYVTLNDVNIEMERKRLSIKDEDIASYMSEIERSFTDTPIIIDSIDVDDLKPPEFYRSVSRNSTVDDNYLDNAEVLDFDVLGSNITDAIIDVFGQPCEEVCSNEIMKEEQISKSKIDDMTHIEINEANVNKVDHFENNNNSINLEYSEKTEDTIENTKLLKNSKNESSSIQSLKFQEINDNEVDINKQINVLSDNESAALSKSSHNHVNKQVNELPESLHTPQTTYPSFPSVTMMEGSRREPKTIRTPPHTEGTPVYTAEVKVVQRASLPTASTFEIPEDMPHHSILLEEYDSASKDEKRRSFNFAAKGWGTYNNFYTPISFSATS